MKKKIIATLLVGAVAVSSVVGLSACGGKSVSLPKGVQVDKEGWEKAFSYENMNKLDNYTLESSGSSNASIKGKEVDEDVTYEIDLSAKSSSYALLLYNEKDGYAYSEAETSSSSKGTMKDSKLNITEKESYKSSGSSKNYYEYDTGLETYWRASYSKSSTSGTNSEEGKSSRNTEEYWNASTSNYLPNNYSNLSYLMGSKYYDKKDIKNAEGGYLPNLYEKFTYGDGVYTATLYKYFDAEEVDIPVAYTVKVCIDSNGYVVGYSEKVNESGTYNDIEDGVGTDCTYNIKYDITFAVTNIGNTNPTTKSNKNITEAIKKAKDRVANLEK